MIRDLQLEDKTNMQANVLSGGMKRKLRWTGVIIVLLLILLCIGIVQVVFVSVLHFLSPIFPIRRQSYNFMLLRILLNCHTSLYLYSIAGNVFAR